VRREKEKFGSSKARESDPKVVSETPMTKPKPKRKTKNLGPNFSIKNNLVTIRYWSQTYTTSLFDKKVKKYVLTCQYPINNFNLDILKNPTAAQIYVDVRGTLYIARIGDFEAFVEPKAITLHVTLVSIRSKSGWDLEHATPSVIYENILADKKFFTKAGRNLDSFVTPLGLRRKENETDQVFRRRTLAYLQFQLEDTEVLSEDELKKLKGDK